MKNVLWESAQRITKQILDWFQDTKDESIRERYFDIFEDGVLENELNNMAIIGKNIDGTLVDFLSIKIDTGVAYKIGERILIDDANIDYDATNISDTTDDGFGNFIPTPHSTGTFDIPVTDGLINSIWIAHLQATDESVFTLNKITNAKQFYI